VDLLGPTVVLYLLVGLGVAAALYLTDAARPPAARLLRLASAIPFWPFYLPILLARPGPGGPTAADDLGDAIARAERELDAALTGLDGRRGRIAELRAAWRAQAERIREMDRLLARPEFSSSDGDGPPSAAPGVQKSLAARRQNLDCLRGVRQRAEADLLASLAWVRELASRIHLSRFTGAPAEQVEELLAEIAAAVERLSAPPAGAETAFFVKNDP
jgi:hypothetical protein